MGSQKMHRPGGSVPAVRLQVSNPSPQVNDEVTLTCTVVRGDTAGVTYGFQSVDIPHRVARHARFKSHPAYLPDGRLFVNHATGTATFIVEESDVGVAFNFTCTATNEAGTSRPSNQQVIIAASCGELL